MGFSNYNLQRDVQDTESSFLEKLKPDMDRESWIASTSQMPELQSMRTQKGPLGAPGSLLFALIMSGFRDQSLKLYKEGKLTFLPEEEEQVQELIDDPATGLPRSAIDGQTVSPTPQPEISQNPMGGRKVEKKATEVGPSKPRKSKRSSGLQIRTNYGQQRPV